MGTSFRPLPVKCVESFLKSKGYSYDRTRGSHDIWTRSQSRSIPLWGAKKEIPAMHLKTSCVSIGITLEDLYDWAKENC